MPHNETKNGEMKQCIENCQSCAEICLETLTHCLKKGGEHVKQQHIALLQVCADICQTSARAMLLNSQYHTVICGACAKICEACAEECGSFENDRMMKECADVCKRCAESCREMTA